MKYWVLLTGCKNNAGDFVIRNRVIHHLRSLRPDRDIIEFNSWEIIDQKKISIINSSEALILAGGPSLRRNIYPDVYPLLNDLNQISVPIIPLGIGWKHYDGSWPSLLNYKFTDASRKLIDKIKSSGCLACKRLSLSSPSSVCGSKKNNNDWLSRAF